MLRTSQTDPLQIASVEVGVHRGKIGITFAPGKNDRSASGGPWARDLAKDLDVIVDWGARALVTLLEPQELASPSRVWAPRSSAGAWNGCICQSAT